MMLPTMRELFSAYETYALQGDRRCLRTDSLTRVRAVNACLLPVLEVRQDQPHPSLHDSIPHY